LNTGFCNRRPVNCVHAADNHADALEPGDVAQLVGCSFLWHSQQSERVSQADISLIILTPGLTDVALDELRCLGWPVSEHEAGVSRIMGGPFTMWLVETDVMAGLGQPILSLVSRVFLNEHQRIIGELRRTGHAALLHYVLQQVGQFRSLGEDFAMQHADTEYLGELEEELQTAVLETIPVEKRLRGLPPEERLRGLPPEERLRGLPPGRASARAVAGRGGSRSERRASGATSGIAGPKEGPMNRRRWA
jgi:hypothetical protein